MLHVGAAGEPPKSEWSLLVYSVPWRELGIASEVWLHYRKLITQAPPSSQERGGIYHAVATQLPRAMGAYTVDPTRRTFPPRTLFLLPISGPILCSAAYAATNASPAMV